MQRPAEHHLKTFICSVSAVQFCPDVRVENRAGVLVCQIDRAHNEAGKFVTALAHLPFLLVQHEAAEAKHYAIGRARELFPEAEGWINHRVVMVEIPRSTFLKTQLFITVKEVLYSVLRLTGFKKDVR